MSKWKERFMSAAWMFARWSKDPRTQVGAIAVDDNKRVVAEGYNGLPPGVADLPHRMEPPAKYLWTLHAEANVVAQAASGVLRGTTVYVTHCCCAQCAALLIAAGVRKVVIGRGLTNMPEDTFHAGMTMFSEALVVVERESLGIETVSDGTFSHVITGDVA
jgi:dCMP deaminase